MIKLREYQSQAVLEAFNALKQSDDPVLFVMSVGGGKSLCAATICKRFEDANKNVLCLVNSSELVRNNAQAFQSISGNPSVFCSSLNKKEFKSNIVFATPQSIMSAIKQNHPIANKLFNLIIVDEAHGIAYKKQSSTFMRILRHYKQEYSDMRLLGLTGTPYRLDSGDTESIVGGNALFKTTVANITTEWLINNGYLVKPYFNKNHVDSIDMSSYHAEKTNKNKQKALEKIVIQNKRLTYKILQEVQNIMQQRNGAFVFCSTIEHCHEAFQALPSELTRIIVGSTPDDERNQILTDARNKKVKYLISVSCLLVGVDVPFFDTTIFLRPTNSLTIFVQAIGRCLRLHEDKKTGLVLDYAGNLTRFSDIDNPIINEAVQQRNDYEKETPFTCYKCSTKNSIHSRRCIGLVDGKRCDYFFQFKTCAVCNMQSDITSRKCRGCNNELIDPNSKLTATIEHTELTVISATYWVSTQGQSSNPVIHAKYICDKGEAYEFFITGSVRANQVTYNNFIKQHCEKPSMYYKKMFNYYWMKQMISEESFKSPVMIKCKKDVHGRFKVVSKQFP